MGTEMNGRLGLAGMVLSLVGAATMPLFIMNANLKEQVADNRLMAEKRSDALDAALQREMRLVTAQVDEKLNGIRSGFEKEFQNNRETRVELLGELQRRLEMVEQPTNTTRAEQLNDLRRRIDAVETLLKVAPGGH